MNLNHQKLSSYNSKESRWGDEEVLLVLQSSQSLLYILVCTLTITYPINVEKEINEGRIYFYCIKSGRKGGNFLLHSKVLGRGYKIW